MKGFFAVSTAVVALLANAGNASARNSHRGLAKRVNHTGRVTWFNLPEGNDACGQPVHPGLPAVHVSKDIWRNGENCNQWMSITINGKQTYGVVTGSCDGCTSEQIDTAPTLFQEFADPDVGVLEAQWHFMNKAFVPEGLDECEY